MIFCLISVLELDFTFSHVFQNFEPFHLAIQKVSIQDLNRPKNAKNACTDMIFIPAQSSLRKAGLKIMSAHAFLGQLRF